jgi:hypothetical protein
MMALTAYPWAFPQQTRLVTGRSVSDPGFQEERREFLKRFANLLRAPAPQNQKTFVPAA